MVLEFSIPLGKRDEFAFDAGQFVSVAVLGLLDGPLEFLNSGPEPIALGPELIAFNPKLIAFGAEPIALAVQGLRMLYLNPCLLQ